LILYNVLNKKYIYNRGEIVAKNKPAFKSNNSKYENGSGQGAKNNNKAAAAPAPKRPMRSSNRGQ
jgi:hypothetical protein